MKIEYLSTVSLEVAPGGGSTQREKRPTAPESLEFIFGIASSGLSPFEQAIQYKSSGDHIEVAIEASKAPNYFGHFYKQLCSYMPLGIIPETFDLTFIVADVKKSEEKDIVKAMAQSLGHGCGGGGCDCGCS